MADAPADRSADTSVPIHPTLAARWSPRAFDPNAELPHEDLAALLEAARWAATWGGRQPVRFIVGQRSGSGSGSGPHAPDETFVTLAGLLKRGNSYAHAASALILLCTDDGPDEKTALYSKVDAGSALANLSVEAVSRGLIVHPMAGFDVDGASTAFALPEQLRPIMIIAVGTLGDYAHVSPEIAERDGRPRERLRLDQIVLNWPTRA
ncbi:MAG: nitroreductase family protein [Mycobacterium sp.]